MTTKQCMTKIKVMMKDDKTYLLKECERLLNSGAINKDDYMQDFVLARIVYHVAIDNLNKQRTLRTQDQKEADNLKCF